ncbi:MAG: hypothetical protein IPF62_10965 [Bacteroidetes bacterium]|nr:hypothetical protein [Bacteroidota bacterium]
MNPRNIYYYSNINGRYRLEVKPNFDRISFAEDNNWKGNLIAGSRENETVNIYDLEYKMDSIYNFNKDDIHKVPLKNFEITFIPGKYTNNKKGYFILSSDVNYLKLRENGASYAKTNFVRCMPGDEVSHCVNIDSNRWMGVILSENIGPHVIMKNYKVNNSPYHFFPQGKELVWASNYSKYINFVAFQNENISRDSIFETTIDLQLNKSLRDILSYSSEGSSIAIINNKGEIICIADKNKKVINPNDKRL